jgi:hypothetical protein
MLLLLYDKLWQINYGQKVFSEKAEPLILTVNKSQSFPIFSTAHRDKIKQPRFKKLQAYFINLYSFL